MVRLAVDGNELNKPPGGSLPILNLIPTEAIEQIYGTGLLSAAGVHDRP
jgi:hypothetical protein